MGKVLGYKISVVHPSYGRPELSVQTAKKWIERAKDLNRIEYIMCLSTKDTEENIDNYIKEASELLINEKVDIAYSEVASLVAQANKGAKHSTGDIILICSDDTDCPENWDKLLLQGVQEAADKRGVDSFFTVKCKDGIQPFLQTMQTMDRAWYEKFGYVLHPDYFHMFCDDDLTMVSHLLDRTLYVDLLFPHLHYSVGAAIEDDTNKKNNTTYNSGYLKFMERSSRNFDLRTGEIINSQNIDRYNFDPFKNQ